MKAKIKIPLCCSLIFAISACSGISGDEEQSYPTRIERERWNERGKLTGSGLTLSGGDEDNASSSGGASPIGVNSFLWRATLDSVSFMPLATADPFGGVVITDWYADPNTPGERFKLNILIMDRQLRADGLKVTAFRQLYNATGNSWKDAPTNPSTARTIEDAILTRARELRMQQSLQ